VTAIYWSWKLFSASGIRH